MMGGWSECVASVDQINEVVWKDRRDLDLGVMALGTSWYDVAATVAISRHSLALSFFVNVANMHIFWPSIYSI